MKKRDHVLNLINKSMYNKKMEDKDMSKRRRREFKPEFKAKVCIELLKEEKTVGEIASKYEIHPNVLNKWKREFLERSSEIFKSKKEKKEERISEDDFFKEIGKLKVENEFLKKNLKKLGMI
jgi:transposase-like protein